jgi:hypothetical protein
MPGRLAVLVVLLWLSSPGRFLAADAPALPAGWKLPPVTARPSLLLTPAETPALDRRLVSVHGALTKVQDRELRTYLLHARHQRGEGPGVDTRKATADFIHYWKSYAKRWTPESLNRPEPDGVSLRGIRRCVFAYEYVAAYGHLSEDETREFRDALVRAIELAIGTDAAHPRITPNHGFRMMNIWTDVAAAAGMVGLAFPELPQSRGWVEFAAREIAWQLENSVWDGAWHECPRYQGAALTIIGLFYESLLRRTGVDLFHQPRYKALLDWLVRFQTPADLVAGAQLKRAEGVILVPALGDSSWTPVPFGIPACFAPRYVRTDPAFAARLMWAWERAGRPYDGDTLENAWVLIRPEIASSPQVLGSDCSRGKGHVVMRSGFGGPDERWLLMRCGNATRAGHDNSDWNAINLYAFGVPLALDAASGDYSHPTHKGWHDRAVAHNTVVFGGRTQKRKDGRILTWVTRPEADYAAGDGSAAAGVERFVRHVVFVKPDYWVIWDDLAAAEPSEWMLHTPATTFEWSPHRVRCTTPWKAALDVHVVWPETPLQPGTQKGRIGNWTTEGGRKAEPFPFDYQDYFGIPAKAGQPHLVVLHPVRPGDAPLSVKAERRGGRPTLEVVRGPQRDRVEFGTDTVRVERSGPARCTVELREPRR